MTECHGQALVFRAASWFWIFFLFLKWRQRCMVPLGSCEIGWWCWRHLHFAFLESDLGFSGCIDNLSSLFPQAISLFTFAVGVNLCLGFAANRIKRAEGWDEGPPTGKCSNYSHFQSLKNFIHWVIDVSSLRNSSLNWSWSVTTLVLDVSGIKAALCVIQIG